MTDETSKPDEDSGKPEAEAEKPAEEAKSKWSTGAKVGAAIGSAAVAAALIYAGRHQMKKHDEFKAAKNPPKYENEPEDEEEDGTDEQGT